MILIWGSRLYGRVDEGPGLFHVATKFGHLWYFPLIPMGSHLVIDQGPHGWRGMPLPFSFRSMLAAWVLAVVMAAAIASGIFAIIVVPDPRAASLTERVVLGALAGLLILLALFLWKSRWMRRASYERACALCDAADVSDEGRIIVELHYGRITKQEAEQSLAQAAQDRAELEALQRAPEEVPTATSAPVPS